ncbi:MAG: ribosome silencing factor [Rhodospirillaceae bacterium]
MPPADEILKLVETSLDDDKAENIVVVDLSGKSAIADYMVIASGTSQRHVGAMADHLQRRMKGLGLKAVTAEGLNQCDWVLIDAGDVIVHLFRPEVRDFYNLEKIWVATPGQAAGAEAAGAST